MRSNNEVTLKSNEKFKNDLHILLICYLNYYFSLENLQNHGLTPQKSYKKVLLNGFKISSKYLGENSFMTQKFMLYYNQSSNIMKSNPPNFLNNNHYFQIKSHRESYNDDRRNEDSNFFLKNSYFPKNFKISTKANKSKRKNFLKSTDAEFFGEDKNNGNNFSSNSEFDNFNSSEKHIFKSHIKEIHYAISDLRRIREEYQKEKTLLENEKNFFLPKSYNNYLEQPYYQKNITNMTPTSFMQKRNSFNKKQSPNANAYSSPIPNFKSNMIQQEKINVDNNLKNYIASLEEENEKLKQNKYEEQNEINQMKDYIKQIEMDRHMKRNSDKNENTFPNFNSDLKIFNNSSPISNVSGLIGAKKVVSQKLDDLSHLNNNSNNNHVTVQEEKSKSSGKYSTKASRNFKLNLEKLLKVEDDIEEDEVIQRKALRYREENKPDEEANKNTQNNNSNLHKNNNQLKNGLTLKKPNPKLSRGAASMDIRTAAEKPNSSKTSLPSQSKIEDLSDEIFDFLGISSKVKFIENCHYIVMNNNNKNEIYRQYVYIYQKVYLKEIRISYEDEFVFININLYQGEDEKNIINNYVINFNKLIEQLKYFDMRDIFSCFIPIKTLKTCEDFIRFCVLPFISVYIFEKTI